jgi:putative hydrolase of the HAD superfamily
MVELEAILKQQGPSYPNIFDKLVERLNLSQALIDEMVRVFIDHDPRINCFEGVIPMLKRLSSRYRLGILTDGRLSVQRKKIRSLGLRPHVDEILCSDRLGKEKPSADLFEWFENRFRLNGVNLIYVGDNPIKDFYGANNRDWHTICVMTGEKKDVDLSNAYLSEFSISSVVELEKMLDG